MIRILNVPFDNIRAMNGNMLKFSVMMLLAFMNLSCSEKTEPEKVSISTASLSFAGDGGTETFTIETESSYSVTAPDWISVSPSEASGNSTVSATAAKNSGEPREDYITVTLSKGKTCKVRVRQEHAEDEKTLDGKKFIVCANSMVYYGGFVLYGDQSSEDFNMFYKLLQMNGVSGHQIIDCTYGSHQLYDYTEAGCKTAGSGCPGVGVDLLKGLDLKSFDYLILSEAGNNNVNFYKDATTLIDRFRSVNPDVKVFYINHIYSVFKEHDNILSQLRKLHDKDGVTIINCGQLAYDIYTKKVQIPGGSVNYADKYTFCNHIGSDSHHPNPLMGYIMTQMMYCALTGEPAEGTDYLNLLKSSKFGKESVSYDDYYAKYYETAAAVPFTSVVENAAEMKGIQQLIPQYINLY